MKLVQIEYVPEIKQNHRLKDAWDEFMGMNVKIAKAELDTNEYRSVSVAASVWSVSIRRYGYPINVTRRGDEIYLIRRDM